MDGYLIWAGLYSIRRRRDRNQGLHLISANLPLPSTPLALIPPHGKSTSPNASHPAQSIPSHPIPPPHLTASRRHTRVLTQIWTRPTSALLTACCGIRPTDHHPDPSVPDGPIGCRTDPFLCPAVSGLETAWRLASSSTTRASAMQGFVGFKSASESRIQRRAGSGSSARSRADWLGNPAPGG